MNQFSVRTTLAALTLISPTLLNAESETIKTELLTLSFTGQVKGLTYGDGGKLLQFSRTAIGPPQIYEGPSAMTFHASKEDQDSGAVPTSGYNVKLPKGADRVLLVLSDFEDSEEGEEAEEEPSGDEMPAGDEEPAAKKLELKAYGITSSTLSEGDYRIFNFSKSPVHVSLKEDGSAIAVAPDEQGDVRVSKWEETPKLIQADFGIVDGEGEEPRMVFNSLWPFRAERRNFIFVFDSGDKFRPLKVQNFYDVPSVKASR